MVSYMASHAKQYISELPGVRHIEVDADAGLDWDPSMISPEASERRRKSLYLYMSRPSSA
jgi:metal-sulfur cluster biosynthetic enzyme